MKPPSPIAATLALWVCAGCSGAKSSAPARPQVVILAVVRGAALEAHPVIGVNVHVFVPGGWGTDDLLDLSAQGFIGRPAQVVRDAKDVDGDGKLDGALEFRGNPFLGREFSMNLVGNVTRPMRMRAQLLDGEGIAAEGAATLDTRGRDITFVGVEGPSPVVEVILVCVKPGGCVPPAGTSDGAAASDVAADTNNDD
jgi:hypothetical protein